MAPNGDLFVADSGANEIHVLHFASSADKPTDTVFASGLNQPYGIAFYPSGASPQWVYVANTDSVVRYPYRSGDTKAAGAPQTIVPDLPSGYHWTRDIVFVDGDSRMLVSVGSNSNIADDVKGLPEGGIAAWAAGHALGAMWGPESDRADVLSFTPDGGDRQVFATGLRNCSGLAVQPDTGAPWCVTNERDQLGDNLPPDFATHLEKGAFYGWPWFYIGNHEDPRAPLKGQRPDLAGKVTTPDVLIQAHSAPLGIAFYQETMFPAEYRGSAFVTLHGSWNRGARTGYKVVRLVFRDGKPTGEYDDFLTGFAVSANAVWGRPVGVAVGKDGSLFVTEDGSGTIWQVTYAGSPAEAGK
jgi:glucose/arabinose dehydrogenase